MNASNAPHGWSEQEDIALMSAWCFISINAVVGTNRTSVNLWENILDQYEKTRKENPTMGEQKSLESLRQRYRRLNTNVSKWIGAYKHAHDRAMSGQSNEDMEKAAQQIYGKSKFTHHKVFESVMRHNPKWKLKLNSTGSSRFQPDDDSLEESQIKLRLRLKGKDKEVATPSCTVPNDFTAALREMRVTRERECDIQEQKIKAASDIQERNIKAAILTPLIARRDLTPEEEDVKRDIIAELFGK
ncbi:glutathione S-transferase T3-like [Salvia splendens]|uniref:glutathione S-transferase T3-like n=1 Tax=Salvia splendens TaxID=180675 RepID=UPI001C25AF5D|nr:glutathione S-transferase T3-like [Salvia splendens]